MAELLNSLFRLNPDRVRTYVDKHRTQNPHLSNLELAQKISTRKSIKNGLLSAGTGVFGVLLLPITVTVDGLKIFRAEAFLFKCINYIYQ